MSLGLVKLVSDFPEIPTIDPVLELIIKKVAVCERLSRDDCLALEESKDFHAVCRLADAARYRLHGDRATYINNAHIDYTNICVSRCKFCAFSRRENDEDAYVLTAEEIVGRVPEGVDEIHIVGGVNPSLHMDYFVDVLQALRDYFPDATLKAFTAVELKALADRESRDIESVLIELKEAGLGMLPGGGAEIFDSEIRGKTCPNKATAEEWLDVHRIAHRLGIPTNSTMLHGHIESPEHRVDHLLKLRELQDETGGFVAHIPLPYLHGNNELKDIAALPNGVLDIKQVAMARLILDNVPHIKAYWRAMGIRSAQLGLRAGADDLDGTVGREDIMHDAGSDAPRALTRDRMETIIKEAGLRPYRRDAFHNPLEEAKVDGRA